MLAIVLQYFMATLICIRCISHDRNLDCQATKRCVSAVSERALFIRNTSEKWWKRHRAMHKNMIAREEKQKRKELNIERDAQVAATALGRYFCAVRELSPAWAQASRRQHTSPTL